MRADREEYEDTSQRFAALGGSLLRCAALLLALLRLLAQALADLLVARAVVAIARGVSHEVSPRRA